jgi:hypothetical protein
MNIPYRDEQILRILAANPDGLTTGQILAIAKTQRGNELPDSNITSQRVYSLRETKTPKIVSIETPAGRIHKLTAAGREIVDALDGGNKPATPTQQAAPEQPPTAHDIEQPTEQTPAADAPIDTDEPLDILAQFDTAVAIIRDGLIAALNAQPEPIRIDDKKIKIELLEKLENMPLLEPWAADLIGEIRVDLDQLEPAE